MSASHAEDGLTFLEVEFSIFILPIGLSHVALSSASPTVPMVPTIAGVEDCRMQREAFVIALG